MRALTGYLSTFWMPGNQILSNEGQLLRFLGVCGLRFGHPDFKISGQVSRVKWIHSVRTRSVGYNQTTMSQSECSCGSTLDWRNRTGFPSDHLTRRKFLTPMDYNRAKLVNRIRDRGDTDCQRRLLDTENRVGWSSMEQTWATKELEPFSTNYYAACAFSGMISTGSVHLLVTPFDMLKVNMQVS